MLPVLYQSPELTLYSYPLFMGLGWGVAYQIFFSLLPESFPRSKGLLLYWGVFLSAWAGAKILFYLTLPKEVSHGLASDISFWMGGGLVFYGGLLGALFFLFVLKLIRFPFEINILWPMLPSLIFGHAIGRIGCFLAGCCFGDLTDWWWGVPMHGGERHPTQILESLGLLVLGTYLLKSKKPRISLIKIYLLVYGVLRFFIEILRGDEIRGQWGSFTPSQWISIFFVISGVCLGMYNKKRLID